MNKTPMEPKLRFRQFFPFRNQYDGAEGGFELLHYVDNTQLTDFAFFLKAQMLHNPATIVRLLYGERTAEEKAAEVFFSSILPAPV
jgi:hypothetical protein